jgi:sporulation protein YlmC with PRC-barrel domain
MYNVLKKTTKVLTVLSVAVLFFAASGADARERSRAIDRTMAPAGVAVNEILGMEVRTQSGEEIASIEDVILSRQGDVHEVVLDYEGDMVAVPMHDMRFSENHAVYMGTRSDLDAARDHYVYGSGPYVYSRGYREPYASGAGLREDYSGPRYQESIPRRGMTGYKPYSSYGTSERDTFRDRDTYADEGYYRERRGYYTGPGATPPRGYTGYWPYRNEFGMADEHVDRYYDEDRGYYDEKSPEEFPPRGMTGHAPYSAEEGPGGRFGTN